MHDGLPTSAARFPDSARNLRHFPGDAARVAAASARQNPVMNGAAPNGAANGGMQNEATWKSGRPASPRRSSGSPTSEAVEEAVHRTEL